MYFSKNYTTKWHDTDACGIVRPSRLVEYMQETANLQCRHDHMDLNTLFFDQGLGFLLSRSQISVTAPLYAYEDIEVRTWCLPSPVRSLSFLRCFAILRQEKIIAEALTTWALMDVRNQKLIRVNDFHGDFPMGDPIDETRLPKKVRIGSSLEMPLVGHRSVVYSDLDFNHHMNNTRYPDMLCDFIPDMNKKFVSSMSLAYLHEASFGDNIAIHRLNGGENEQADSYLFKTINQSGTVCLEAEIKLSSVQ